MAVLTRRLVGRPRARPIMGMRFAAGSARAVAADAIGRRPLIMARSASLDVAARSATMEVTRTGIGPEPANRVRVGGADAGSTHAPEHVTRVAAGRLVAAATRAGARTGLDRVLVDEVEGVYRLAGIRIRLPQGHRQVALRVVTILAPRLRMALMADVLLPAGVDGVPADPGDIVSHEALGYQRRERLGPVTRGTTCLVEIGLVAFEARSHGRRHARSTARLDHARVAEEALAGHLCEAQVVTVGEVNFSPRPERLGRGTEAPLDGRVGPPVTIAATLHGRGPRMVRPSHVGVARGAGGALRLTFASALEGTQVLHVRESGARFRDARRKQQECRQAD